MSVVELESTRRTVRRTRGASDLRARARVDELDDAADDATPAVAAGDAAGAAGDAGAGSARAATQDAPTLVSEPAATNLAAFERVRAVRVDPVDGASSSGSSSGSSSAPDGGAGTAAEPKVLARAVGDEDPATPA